MPPESAIATQIRTALAQHIKRDASKVRAQDNLREDLGLDSLAMLELVFKIEEAFDLEIPDEDLSTVTTVGDVIAYVEMRLGPRAPAPAAAAAPEVPGATTPPAAKKKAPRPA